MSSPWIKPFDRSLQNEKRKEDTVVLYYGSGGVYESVKKGEHHFYPYEILTNGKNPMVEISMNSHFATAGTHTVLIHNDNDETRYLDRKSSFSGVLFSYTYNKDDDHRYTLEEIENETISFINSLMKMEDEYLSAKK